MSILVQSSRQDVSGGHIRLSLLSISRYNHGKKRLEQFMELDITINKEKNPNIPIINLKGEIDIYTCPKLNETLNQLIEDQEHHTLLLNLESIQYIDSTGLGSIAYSARQLDKKDGEVLIVCTKPQVIKIFEVSGLSKKNIELFDNEDDALAARKD